MKKNYKNSFKIGDDIVCTVNSYAWINYRARYRVAAVNRTGSIGLYGITGSYNPDNFMLASDYDDCESGSNEGVKRRYVAIDSYGFIRGGSVLNSIEEAINETDTIFRFSPRDNVKIFEVGNEVVQDRDLFRIAGYYEGSKFYAKKSNNLCKDSATFGKFPIGADHTDSKYYFDMSEADLFTLEEAKPILKHYNDPNFSGWAKNLFLELVDSGK